MTYRDAIEELIRVHGEETIYSNGAWDADGHNLREIMEQGEDDAKQTDYCYSRGASGSRPGVYIVQDNGLISSVPAVEPRRE